MNDYQKPSVTYDGGTDQPTPRCSVGLAAMVAYAGAVYDVGAAINYAVVANMYLFGAVAFAIIGVESCWPA